MLSSSALRAKPHPEPDVRQESSPNLMEPLGRAFVRSVAERPADGGLFGPRSMVWRVHRDRSFALAALRSLMATWREYI
jgi:hypothetical protein